MNEQPQAEPTPTNQPPTNNPGMPPQQVAYYQQPAESNTMAILGMVFAIAFWPAGLVLSIIGLNKSKATGAGQGLSIAGLITSVVVGLITIILAILMVIGFNEMSRLENECRDRGGIFNSDFECIMPTPRTWR